MRDPIPKLRERSIISKKRFLSELQLPQSLIFLGKILQTSST